MPSRFRHHVFSCQNVRAAGSRPSCGGRGAAAVLRALQGALAADPELCERVCVTGSACLGPCFDGPMLVVYPEGVWYRGVAVADVEEIVTSHLRGGAPVARLRYQWPDEDEGAPEPEPEPEH